MKNKIKSKNIKGFTLVELMISLTLGAVIISFALVAYLGATTSSIISEAQSQMSENAQEALFVITQQLKVAGNNPKQYNRTNSTEYNPVYNNENNYIIDGVSNGFQPSKFIILGCDGQFNNFDSNNNIDILECNANHTTNSVAVNYEADIFNTIPSVNGVPTDCLGNELKEHTVVFPPSVPVTATTSSYFIANNILYIDKENDIPSLFCKGSGNVSKAMVSNVENLKIKYGVMNENTTEDKKTTATVAGYLTASEIDSKLTSLPISADRWSKVITVKICITVRSEKKIMGNRSEAGYINCDGNIDNSNTDLYLRHSYNSTVVLRNRRI